MKLDGATIAIEPRSVGACIDLAVLFTGTYFAQVLGLTLCGFLPACALTYWLAAQMDGGLWVGLVFYFFFSPLLGAALIAGAGHRAFGDSFSVWRSIRIVLPRLLPLFIALTVARFAIACVGLMCILPGLLPAVRYGFISEILVLEGLDVDRLLTRAAVLTRGVIAMLALRLVVIVLLCAGLSIAIFAAIDFTFHNVFDYPILSGRISGEFIVDELPALLANDPRVVTAIMAALWLVYPVGRLSWFMCYLDTRIRREAWDLELDFRVESLRLRGAEESPS
jgi:hypothetical protein